MKDYCWKPPTGKDLHLFWQSTQHMKMAHPHKHVGYYETLLLCIPEVSVSFHSTEEEQYLLIKTKKFIDSLIKLLRILCSFSFSLGGWSEIHFPSVLRKSVQERWCFSCYYHVMSYLLPQTSNQNWLPFQYVFKTRGHRGEQQNVFASSFLSLFHSRLPTLIAG